MPEEQQHDRHQHHFGDRVEQVDQRREQAVQPFGLAQHQPGRRGQRDRQGGAGQHPPQAGQEVLQQVAVQQLLDQRLQRLPAAWAGLACPAAWR